MCYFWGETGRYINSDKGGKPESLDIDRLKQLVHELAPARPNYELFGGEPFTYSHLEEIIRLIKDAGSFVIAPTNGTLLPKHAPMLVESGFDSIRVSIDGPREVNDSQRGAGSYDKAMAGIQAVFDEKQRAGSHSPILSVSYTLTPENYLFIERFFLHELNLDAMDWVTIQSQNFITEKMGLAYARLLESEFGITSDSYWRGLVRSPEELPDMDTVELARQVGEVQKRLAELGKNVLLLPPTFTPENLSAYFRMKWGKMSDRYTGCPAPWSSLDITAHGDVAPCHIFYDLVMGNIYEESFADIWNGESYRKFRAYMKKHGLMSICPGCCVLYLAGSQ
jgi:radical SAM protein with 4Fe4S-binding SPASM domain